MEMEKGTGIKDILDSNLLLKATEHTAKAVHTLGK